VLLTPLGKKKALKLKYFQINKRERLKKRKDGKWIMIIFDIPEKKRKWRDELRGFLYNLGFQVLQKSVWISPYNVLDRLREIVTTLSLDKYTRVFLIEEKLIR
jgi:phenylacetic acid degradation operon negative regulatory protein